jgi:hypothetical protein
MTKREKAATNRLIVANEINDAVVIVTEYSLKDATGWMGLKFL